MSRFTKIKFLATVALITAFAVSASAGIHPAWSEKVKIDTLPFYTGADYDPAIPAPNDYLVNDMGEWPLRYHELIRYIGDLDKSSDRVQAEIHSYTQEGQPQFNIIVSSPENISKLDDILAGIDKIADPSLVTSKAQLDSLVANLPATAWLGFNIHGDEISGTDAGILLAYHLAAARDEATIHLLDNIVIIIDPCENPDGRERYLAMLQTNKSQVPNYDAQSMQHGGVWPWGRGNHYLFDLNRDWILLTQKETLGKVATMLKWHPQLVVDAHEMGSSATYLFSPPVEPINYNIPDNVIKWYQTYQLDQADAYDERGWPYYSGEWNEQWYPGYGSAWPTYHGAVGILYEQAGTDGMPTRQAGNYILTFHEAVNHQFTSALVNLKTTADNRASLLFDYHQARKKIVQKGRKSGLQFLFVPDEDEIKMKRFIESLTLQGIRVTEATDQFSVSACTDPYNNMQNSKSFPEGTYIVSTAQPLGALAKAVLGFDPHLKLDFLKEERRELEKNNESKLYEVTTWSVPLAYDIDAWYTNSSFSVNAKPVEKVETGVGKLVNPEARFGFVINMEGEKTYQILGRIFAEELVAFCAVKPFSIEGNDYRSGSVLLRKRGNPENLSAILGRFANETGIDVIGVNTGNSSKGSDLGASTFRLMIQPRVALISGTPMDYTAAGSTWFLLDQELKMPHSLIQASELGRRDISQYNLIILPSSWGNSLNTVLGQRGKEKLERWVEAGGSLICTGSSAIWAADSSNGLSQVRQKRQSLEMLDKYQLGIERERRAESPPVDTMELWHPKKVAVTEKAEEKKPKPDKKELEKLDEWQRKFRPGGVIFRADIDTEDWLAFGMRDRVPVMVYTRSALLATKPVKVTARYADYEDIRMSGLLWPEARERWATTVFATHEGKGRGQVVLFATEPNMRAYFYGTRKMFVNAIIYGPSMVGRASAYGE